MFLPPPCVQCFRVSIPPAVRPTLLRQIEMGSLTCAPILVRVRHMRDFMYVVCEIPFETPDETQYTIILYRNNIHAHKFGCVPYTRRGVRHKQVCTTVDSEGQKNCLAPCPARGSNPGSPDLISDSLTTEQRPPSEDTGGLGCEPLWPSGNVVRHGPTFSSVRGRCLL